MKGLRKIISAVLACTMVFGTVVHAETADVQTVIGIGIDDVTASVGDYIEVPIEVKKTDTTMCAIDFDVSFDASVLRLIGVEGSDMVVNANNAASGEVRIVYTSLSGISEASAVATLHFEVRSEGSSEITIHNLNVYDFYEQDVITEIVPGTITVTGEEVPEEVPDDTISGAWLVIDAREATVGDSIKVPIVVEQTDAPLSILYFTVHFEDEKLRFVDIYGSDDMVAYTSEAENGFVRVTYEASSEGLSASDVVATLEFDVIESGSAYVDMAGVYGCDADKNTFVVQVVNGLISISDPQPEEPETVTEEDTEATSEPTTEADTTAEATTEAGTTAEEETESDTSAEGTTEEEPSTEVTTGEPVTVTDATTETTTKRRTTGSGAGAGSNLKVVQSSGVTAETTTTDEETEDTTDDYDEDEATNVVTEGTTESTTDESFEVEITVGSNAVRINNSTVYAESAPYIQAGSNSAMVPLRMCAVILTGGQLETMDSSNIVQWDSSTREAIITYNGKEIVFREGEEYMLVDDVITPISNRVDGAVPEIVDNRLYVPCRTVAEVFDVYVDWNAATGTILFTR